jgi:hypothetical protein
MDQQNSTCTAPPVPGQAPGQHDRHGRREGTRGARHAHQPRVQQPVEVTAAATSAATAAATSAAAAAAAGGVGGEQGVAQERAQVREGDARGGGGQRSRGVAAQVGFEKAKALKPISHLIGSRVEIGRFQAMGHKWIKLVQPHRGVWAVAQV